MLISTNTPMGFINFFMDMVHSSSKDRILTHETCILFLAIPREELYTLQCSTTWIHGSVATRTFCF